MSKYDPLRVGICGLGFMGRTHFNHLSKHPHARVVALCDADADRREGRWQQPTGNIGNVREQTVDLSEIRAYATPEELAADQNVDAIVLTLPTPAHPDVAERALRAGKHVICEKPMARDLAGCDRMIAAATDADRTLMIAQCIRFWPQYEQIKALLDEGRIGPVRFAHLRRIGAPPTYSKQNWLMDANQSGGALLDLHVHDVDFAHHLLGVPDTVFARGRTGPSGGTDHVFATYGYADGRYALIEGGWTYHTPWKFEMAITVQGDKGTLEWSSLRGADVLLYAGGEKPETLVCAAGNGWTRELDYFVECLRGAAPVTRCLPESSRTSIALALLEQRSIQSGRVLFVAANEPFAAEHEIAET